MSEQISDDLNQPIPTGLEDDETSTGGENTSTDEARHSEQNVENSRNQDDGEPRTGNFISSADPTVSVLEELYILCASIVVPSEDDRVSSKTGSHTGTLSTGTPSSGNSPNLKGTSSTGTSSTGTSPAVTNHEERHEGRQHTDDEESFPENEYDDNNAYEYVGSDDSDEDEIIERTTPVASRRDDAEPPKDSTLSQPSTHSDTRDVFSGNGCSEAGDDGPVGESGVVRRDSGDDMRDSGDVRTESGSPDLVTREQEERESGSSEEEYVNLHGKDGTVLRIMDVGYEMDFLQSTFVDAISCKSSLNNLTLIVRCGVQINDPVKKGLRPLHYAAYVNNTMATRFLLNFGAEINARDEVGCTALHICSRRGNMEAMEVLLQNGACINFCDATEESPEDVKSLGYMTLDPMNIAIENNHVGCVRLLLKYGARPDHKYFMGHEITMVPLEHLDCLEALLQAGADPNVFNRCGTCPLMKACKTKNLEAVRLLLRFGADVDLVCPEMFEQRTAMHFTVEFGTTVILHLLLRIGANTRRPRKARYGCLHTAIIKDRPDMAELLLQWEARVDELTDEAATSLQLACSSPGLSNRKQLIEILLFYGANPNLISPERVSFIDPFMAPLVEYLKTIGKEVSMDIVHLLLRSGAQLCFSEVRHSMRCKDRFSVLEFVPEIGSENTEVLHLLMEAASFISYEGVVRFMNKLLYVQRAILFENCRKPASLLHNARIAIRRSLPKAKFEDSVRGLPVPPSMQDYIVFDYRTEGGA